MDNTSRVASINPFHHVNQIAFKKNTAKNKITIVALTILASLLFVVPGLLVFSYLSHKWSSIHPNETSSISSQKTNECASKILSNTKIDKPFAPVTPPPLNLTSPSWVDFNAEKNSTTLFSLMNLDFMSLNTKGGKSTMSLPFLIQQLTALLEDENLSLEAKEKIKTLIKSYEFTYATAHWQSILRQKKSPQNIMAYKKAIQDKIFAELTKEKNITISTGYQGDPAGHEIALTLSLIEKEGKSWVQGTVINLGEGTDKHPSQIVGHKEKRQGIVTLLPVSLEKLKGSSFLDCLLDLNFTEIKDSEPLSIIEDHTRYGIDDFYEAVLPLWPKRKQKIAFSEDKSLKSRTTQRGGSCTVKPYLFQLKDALGDKEGNYCKFQMKLASLKLFLQEVPLSLRNKDAILSTLNQLHRTALKFYDKGIFDQKQLEELNIFSNEVKAEIKNFFESSKHSIFHETMEFSNLEGNNYECKIRACQPFSPENITSEEIPPYTFPDLTHCDLPTLSQFLNTSYDILKELCLNQNLSEASQYAACALMTIPSSDAPIWESLPLEELAQLHCIQRILINKDQLAGGIKTTTPNEGILHIKCLAITLKASLKELDTELIAFMLRRVPTYIDRDTLYSGSSSSSLANEAICAYSIIDNFFKDRAKEKSMGRLQFDVEEFENMEECLEHPEMRYLINQISTQSHEKSDDADLIERAIELGYKNLRYPSVDDPLHNPETKVTPFHLIKTQYLMLFYTFFLKSSDEIDCDFIKTYGSFPYIYTETFSKKLCSLKTRSRYNQYDQKELIKLTYSQGLTKDEISAYSDVVSPTLTQNQNASIGTTQISGLPDIHPSELQELLSINCQPNLQIAQAVNYFESYPHRFKKGLFRAIFSDALFHRSQDSKCSNIQKCMKHPMERNQLFAFFRSAFGRAKKTKLFGVQCFLLKTWIQALVFLAHSDGTKQPLLTQEISRIEVEIKQLLASNLGNDNRAALTHTLIASYSYIQESDQIKDVLAPLCAEAYHEIKNLGHEYDFERKPNDPTDAYDRSPQFKEDFEKGKFYLENDISYNEEHSLLLPNRITNHDLYKIFFNNNYKAKKLEINLYEFQDHQEQRYRVQINADQTLSLYWEKSNGDWYQYQPKSPFIGLEEENHPCNQKGLLGGGNTFWYHMNGKDALALNAQKQVVLTITKKAIQKGENGNPPLFLATNYETDPTLNHLSRLMLDKKKEILMWKKADGDLSGIEIPSLKLSFHKEKTSDGRIRWMSDSHPGYYLDAQTETLSLEPFNHYVLLKNANNQQIALMPSYSFKNQQPQFPWKKLPKIISSPKDATLFTYSLKSNGSLQLPHKVEDLLYLIHISLVKQDYPLAHQALKKLKQHPAEWGLKAFELLENFKAEDINKRDNHPHALSLRVKLNLLARDSLQTSLLKDKKTSSKMLNDLDTEYELYLNQLNNMGQFSLHPEEEIECLNLVADTPLFNLRRQEIGIPTKNSITIKKDKTLEDKELELLEQDYSSSNPQIRQIARELLQIHRNIENLKKPSLKMEWLSASIQKKMVKHCKHPAPVILKIRPGSAFVKNFLYYYQIARSETATDKELTELLQVSRFSKDPQIQSLRQTLLQVLEHAENYPPFEEMLQAAQEGQLHKKLQDLNIKHQKTPKAWTFDGNFKYSNFVMKPKAKSLLTETKPRRLQPLLQEIFSEDPIQKIPLEAFFIPVDSKKAEDEIEKKKRGVEDLMQIFTPKESSDPCIDSEYRRFLNGIEIKKQEVNSLQTDSFIPDLNQLEEIKETLTEEITTSDEQLIFLRKEILAISRNYPLDLQTEVNAGLLAPLKFSELMLSFGREDDQSLLIANPSLSNADLQQIKELMREYLLTKRHQQQCLRLHKSICTVHSLHKEGTEEGMQAECREFMRLYESRPCYQSGNPHLLVFEVMGDILVRQDQYEKLMQMTEDGHAILEARTGFGKSKVLIPLWLYLTSQKRETLSMMTVPSSLFFQQVAHLKNILGNAYSQSILEVHLNREQAQDVDYLKRLNKRLDDAIDKKMCAIADINTIHHLVDLAFKENLCQEIPNQETRTELLKIRKTIAEKLSLFIDESRECLDIRHHYNDSLGQPKPIDPKHCQAVGKLYQELILEESQNWAFEFLPDAAGKTPLSEKEYDKNLLPLFAKKLVQVLNVDKQHEEAILKDLQGEYTPLCEEFYRTLSESGLKDYAIYKKQLMSFLRLSLNRHAGEYYGLSKASPHRFAIPYARGKPSEKSEFSTLDILLNFTIQANLKEPFRLEDIEQFVDTLKNAVLKGTLDENNPCISLCEQLLENLNLSDVKSVMDVKSSHIIAIQDFLNDPVNQNFKLQFIIDYILPQITLYEKKVSSSTYNILSEIKNVKGASGTVNPGILPQIDTLEDPTAPIDNLLSMIDHSKHQVYEIPDTNRSHEKLLHILNNYPDYRALIDVDGSFREMSPEKVAQSILDHGTVKAVSYYDHAGRNLVLQKGSKLPIPFETCGLPLNQIFTYFPQSSVVGSDTPISLLAKALVTVNKSTELDLFLQGVGRMRGLQKGQQVGLIFNHSDSQVIQESYPGALSLESILCHMTDKQGAQRGKDQFLAIQLMLENHIETYLKKNYPDKFKEYIAKSTQTDPLLNLRENKKIISAKDAVEQLVSRTTACLADFLSHKKIQAMNENFLKTINYDLLPKSLFLNQADETTAYVEVETTVGEVSQEVELEEEQTSEEIVNNGGLNYKPATYKTWEGSNYKNAMQPYKQILGENISVSPNYLRIAQKGEVPLRKPAYQYMIVQDPQKNTYDMIFLDLYDANEVLKAMRETDVKTKGPLEKRYYLYSGDDIIAADSSEKLSKKEWEENDQLIKLGIIRKIYTANPHLTTTEKKLLKRNENASWMPNLKREIKNSIKIWPKMAKLKKYAFIF